MKTVKNATQQNPYPIMTVAYYQWQWRNELKAIKTLATYLPPPIK